MEIQGSTLFLKKQKNYSRLFTRNSEGIVNKIIFNLNTYKMTQYNSLNVKLSNSQLNKLKSSIKNETDVV